MRCPPAMAEPFWTYTAGDAFYYDPVTVVNGTLYFNNSDGKTRALTLAAGLSAMARPALAKLSPNRALTVR